MDSACFSRLGRVGAVAVLAVLSSLSAFGQNRVSPYTTEVFIADGDINEFIRSGVVEAGDPTQSQNYFELIEALPNFGLFRPTAILTRGVLPARDRFPGPGEPNPAGPSGFRDRPAFFGAQPNPTGFNAGRIFASYNPDIAGGAYFIGIDVSAPAVLDLASGTQPVAFDVDGDGSVTQVTEFLPGQCILFDEAPPSSLIQADNYIVFLDLNVDGVPDVCVKLIETSSTVAPVPTNAVFLGSYQTIPTAGSNPTPLTIRRWIQIDPLNVAMTDPQLLRFSNIHLDSNNDGLKDVGCVGVGDDVEFMIARVNPSSLDPILDVNDPFRTDGTNRCCVGIRADIDSDDDQCIGGGAEESIEVFAEFACPSIEVTKQVRCVDPTASAFGASVNAVQGSIVEFRIAITNFGNTDLNNVRIVQDVLNCVNGTSLTIVPGSFVFDSRPTGIRDFSTDFLAALSNPGLFPLRLDAAAPPPPGQAPASALLPAPAVGICTPFGVAGESIVFRFRAQTNSNFATTFCNTAIDCSNTIAVCGDTFVNPIPDASNPGPDGPEEDGPGLGNVADEFTVTVCDDGTIRTPREVGAGDDRADVNVLCRDVTLLKQVGFPGLPGSFVTGNTPLPIQPFAGTLDIEYRYTVTNLGDTTEQITLTDSFLCADVTATPGVSLIACTLCPGGSIVDSYAPGQQRIYTCRIRFANQAALEAFVLRDDARPACQAAPSAGRQQDCYKNCASIVSNIAAGAAVCGPAAPQNRSSDATICVVRCELQVEKLVRCLRGTDTTFRPSVEALPGETVQFRVRIVNTGSQVICRLRIRDLLSTLTGSNCLGSVSNIVFQSQEGANAPITCATPAGFNTTDAPFEFRPCTPDGTLHTGDSVIITFNVLIPANATANCTSRNRVIVECASQCPDPPGLPQFCCEVTAQADVSVLVPSIACTKQYTTFQWDENGDCIVNDPVRNFTNPLTDLINFNASGMAVVFPVVVNLRITASNNGETALVNVTANDNNLITDITVPPIPGVSIVSSQLGQTRNINPGQTATWDVSIRFDTAAAARVFATRDDDTPTCRNQTLHHYRNCASVSGNVDVPDGVCEPPTPLIVSSNCQADIAFPGPCTILVDKAVKCSTDPDASFGATVTAIPGAILTFKIDVTNTGTVKIPRICLRDLLGCNWPVVSNVTATLGGLDVSSVFRAAGNAFGPDNVQRCYTFGTVRPAQPWINPGETLSLRFNVQAPADDTLFPLGQNPDCVNTIFVESFTETCVPPGVTDAASCSGNDNASIDIRVPRIECDKQVCIDFNNDGDCNDAGEISFGSAVDIPCTVQFPFTILYRFTVANTGETAMTNVRIRDLELVNDARNIPGVTIVSCGLCSGACDGVNDTEAVLGDIPAGQVREAVCRIRFDSRAAWQAFALTDPASGNAENDLNCYENVATATGTVSGPICTAGADPNRSTAPCESTVCLKICDLDVTKEVRCLDQCQLPADPNAGYAESVTVAPGACVQYRITVLNTSQTAVSLCSLRIRDVLDQNCVRFDDSVTLTILRAGGGQTIPCFVPAVLNGGSSPLLTNTAFEFVPGDCDGGPQDPPLQPGDRLVLTFRARAQTPPGGLPSCSTTNTVTVEGATVCGTGPRVYCCSDSDTATVNVETCSFNLTKSVVCLDASGNPTGPEGATLAALRGSKARFRFRVTNTSGSLPITRLCITDGMTCAWTTDAVTAFIGATNVTATFATFRADGVRRCFDMSGRPLAPGETLTVSFDVQIPANFDLVCTPVDCVNAVTVEGSTALCAPPGGTDSICGTRTATASIDVRVPKIQCTKRVTVQNNDGTAPVTGTDVVIEAPVYGNDGITITYTMTVRNVGDVPLSNVQICDDALVANARAAGLQVPNCQLCDIGGCDGANDACATIPVLAACPSPCIPEACPSASIICQIVVADDAQWQAFAALDSDSVNGCYLNTVRVLGTPILDGLCGPVDVEIVESECQARVCLGRSVCPCPPIVKANFRIWNQNEVQFSGVERCLNAWDSTLLSQYVEPFIPNALTLAILQTAKGKARIDGIGSAVVCGPNSISAPLLGVAERQLTFQGGNRESAGDTLVGLGSEFGQVIWKRPPLPTEEPPPPPPPGGGGPTPDEGAQSLGNRVAQVGHQGSMLVYPKVQMRTNAAGQIIEDTFIELSNNYFQSTRVQMYFINGNPCRCNWLDNTITLTQNEASYWAISSGDPKGVSPWRALDPFGEADSDPSNPGGRLWRGWIIAWAVDSAAVETRWNFLSGVALNVNYENASAWQYLPWGFAAVAGVNTGDRLLAPYGQLDLDGVEYVYAPDQLVLDFYASGSHPFGGPGAMISIDTDLTLVPLLRNFQTNDPQLPEEIRTPGAPALRPIDADPRLPRERSAEKLRP